jgi:molecular chaperone HscB
MTDHFQRLGVPRTFDINPESLERAYLARSRAVHPDFHTTSSDAELAASVELSAALNEAYNTLRDPFTRAEYLLSLLGGPSANEQRQMPGDFLAQMLEARERLEQARADPLARAALENEFTRQYDELLGRAADDFKRVEGAPDATEVLLRIRATLNAAKYVRGLLRDLRD